MPVGSSDVMMIVAQPPLMKSYAPSAPSAHRYSLSWGNVIQEPKEAASTRPKCLVRVMN